MATDIATTWEGIDELRGKLTSHWDTLVYVSLAERSGSGDDRIARIDVRRKDAQGKLVDQWPGAKDEAIENLCNQIRHRTEQSAIGLAVARFRCQFFTEGSKNLDSATIVVRPGTPGSVEGGGSTTTPIGALTRAFDLPVTTVPAILAPEDQARDSMNALAAYYGSFLNEIVAPFLQRALLTMDAISSNATAPLIKQVERLQNTNENLAREVALIRKAEIDGENTAKASEAQAKATAEIVTTTVNEAAGLARAFVAMKAGIRPELADVLSIVGDDEQLMKTLQDPKVRVMLADPANRAQLVALLKAGADETPDPTPAGDPPGPSKESPNA